MAWTAGKIGEWYEDKPPANVTGSDEGYWPPSWWDQHQRLVGALTEQPSRPAITISGDMHASGAKRVTASGDIDLSRNPLEAVLSGPIGTGNGWPSLGRGMFPSCLSNWSAATSRLPRSATASRCSTSIAIISTSVSSAGARPRRSPRSPRCSRSPRSASSGGPERWSDARC